MTHVQVSFPDGTIEMIDELQCAVERNEGYKPTRSQLLRMAVATLRKRMSDEGLLRAPKTAKEKRQSREAQQ